jgi:hypothetical protein
MKRWVLLLVVVTACLLGFVAKTSAVTIPDGLSAYEGYFHHGSGPDYGDLVLPPDYSGGQCPSGLSYCAIPASVNSVSSFENFIINDAQHGNAWQKLGASFIIQTMLPPAQATRNLPPTATQIKEWKADVDGAASDFRFFKSFSYNINSFCQNADGTEDCSNKPVDDAFFPDSNTQLTIELLNSKGDVIYAIKYLCSNPVGHDSMGHLPQANQYTNDANSTITYNSKTYTNVTAFPGQTVVFNHYIHNAGPDADKVDWTTHNVETGKNLVSGSTTVGNGATIRVNWETYTIPLNAIPGTKYCRYISYSPKDENGGSGNGNTVCVTVGSDFDLTPTVNESSSTIDPGGKITFTYVVYNGGRTYSTSVDCTQVGNLRGAGYAPLPQQDVARKSDPGYAFGATTWVNKCPRDFPDKTTVTLATETYTVPAATPIGDSVCRSLVLNPKATGGGPVTSAETCAVVVYKPYVSATGGDVEAGAPMAINGSDCTTITQDTTAGVVSWNQENAAYSGAGVQYAAVVLNYLQDFATGQGSGLASSGLSFANTTHVSGTDLFGGGYGSEPCVPDYFGPAGTMTPTYTGNHTFAAGDMNKAVYVKGGDLTVGATTVANDTNTVVYVSGNVYINGSITFSGATGGYPAVTDIPSFSIIATGNIYIAPGAAELDGVYVAEPTSAVAGGNIYTCTTAPFAVAGLTDSVGTYYTTCNTKLDVYGSFIAKKLWLLRTSGSLSTGPPAETFHYDPETWLAEPSDVIAGQGSAGSYNSITSLPPVL